MIELHATPDSQQIWNEMIARLDALSRPDADDILPLQEVIRAGFAFNFANEAGGDAPWAALTPFTVRERGRLGFPGEHPILVRTGDYRASFVDETHRNHVSEWSATGGLWVVEEGSSDPRAEELEYGRFDMEPRPVSILGESGEQRIDTVIHLLFDGWFEED